MNSEKDVRIRVAGLIQAQYRGRGLTRIEFAKQLGISARAVAYWMEGTSQPQPALRPRIEEMFGWPPGVITQMMVAGMNGKPLDQIRIAEVDGEPLPKVPGSDPAAERSSIETKEKPLERVPASDLADELVNRLRAAEDEVLSLRRQLEDAQRSLRRVQRSSVTPR